jgi:hypothetical protein
MAENPTLASLPIDYSFLLRKGAIEDGLSRVIVRASLARPFIANAIRFEPFVTRVIRILGDAR